MGCALLWGEPRRGPPALSWLVLLRRTAGPIDALGASASPKTMEAIVGRG
jgi:hypothetical protein